MAPSTRQRIRRRAEAGELRAYTQFREWTDDFSNIQRILK
jgi:hypothetical protein